MFVGRLGTLHELLGVVEHAQAGDGGGRWVVGDAGMGKTALLRQLVEQVDPGVRVLWATGREGETELAWGVLQQLIGPLVEEGFDASLPEPQRLAVRSALAIENDPAAAGGSPLAPAVGSRNVLVAAAGDRPLLVVVDDWHWADQPSRRTLEYLLARVEGTQIALVLAGRPEEDGEPSATVLHLGPLEPEASLALLYDHGVHDRAVGERILDQLGGNPLLLQAAATELDGHQRAGMAALPDVLPVPASVTRLAEQRLAALDAATRDAVLVAAVAPGGELRTVSGAVRVLGHDDASLEAAEAADVVRVAEARVTFTHPTLRSAAFHSASAAERRRVHGAVAEVLADEVAQAWHAGQAVLGPDEATADALSRAADTLVRRRAPVAAASYLERAAGLTSDPDEAAVRLRLAAEALAETGRAEAAEQLLDHADSLSGAGLEGARRQRLRLRLAARSGATDEVVNGLRELAADVEPLDAELSAAILLDALPALVRSGRGGDIELVAKAALEHAERAGSDRLARRSEVVLGALRLARGELEGQALLDRYAEVLEVEGALEAAPFLAEVVAPYLGLLRRGPDVDALLDSLERELRAAVAIPALIVVLAARALLSHGRDLRQAAALNTEAIELADAIDQPELAVLAAAGLAVAAGVMGDERLVALAAERCAWAPFPSPAAGLSGQAALHLGRGDLDEALAVYEELYERFGIGTSLVRWEGDWCEALVRTRDTDRALAMIDEFAGGPTGRLATGQIHRVRIMLAADDDEAAAQYAKALRFVDLVPNDVVRGRTELVWGERLRRSRKRSEARAHLEEAARLLRRVGADPWAERAERELVAAGAAPAADQGKASALTNQERDIVRLAVSGATNRAIADQMFLSPRTVETHLGSAYRKLGVANRRELMTWAAEGPGLDEGRDPPV